MPTLHVVIPVYNERDTLEECLRRVLAVQLPDGFTPHLWLVDDCSNDENYAEVVRVHDLLAAEGHALTLNRHEVNQGKGGALQTGFDAILSTDAARDDYLIIQDADLEYDPNDYADLMAPLLADEADVVLGTRWGEHRDLTGLKRRIHAWGNGALTTLSNLMTGHRVSDMECCYKVFSIAFLDRLRPMLSEKRFGIEPQMVASMSRLKARVTERPIHYDPRGLDAGKKIGWKDGVRAIWVIARERFRGTPPPPETPEATPAADSEGLALTSEDTPRG